MERINIARLIEKLKKSKKLQKKLEKQDGIFLKRERAVIEELPALRMPPAIHEEDIVRKIEERVDRRLREIEKKQRISEEHIEEEKVMQTRKEKIPEIKIAKPGGYFESHELGIEQTSKMITTQHKEVAEFLVPEELIGKLKMVNEVKPLIKLITKDKEITFAWMNIKWNEETHSLTYNLYEPELSDSEKKVLKEIKTILQEKLDISFEKVRADSANTYLTNKIHGIIKDFGLILTEEQRLKIEYYIFRDFIGLGKIEPLMRDANIEDISADGVGIPVFLVHRNPLYGELQTNLKFETQEELDSFVLKLSQRCGKALSVAEPLLDGSLPDGSRVQATLGTDIARRGSNFSIRKFIEEPLSPIDLMNFGTATAEVFAYLWLAIENRLSVLVAGPVATGKTTFLNCLSLFIKPELKIISIEDTSELKLPHPNWIPEVARIAFGREKYGEVSMFDLLKAALRQRPDYIIVGEVRGVEAYVMFQGMATGHPSLGTIHADDFSSVIDRLITKPINLSKALLQNLDICVFLTLTRKRGEYIRRVREVVEVVNYDLNSDSLVSNISWKWDPASDSYVGLKSVLLEKIKEKMGYSIDLLKKDLNNRINVLKWLQKNNIRNFKDVSMYFSMYYSNPQRLIELVEGKK